LAEQKLKPYLSVIIPCYNEGMNLEKGRLEEVYIYLMNQKYNWELIIINDGSTDNSKRLIQRFMADKTQVYLLNISHGGKPVGIWKGVKAAKGDIVLFADMDQSTPIQELDNLLVWFDKGYDVVIGSRHGSREGFSLIRKIGSVVFRNLRRFVLLSQIRDTQCGFKLCRRNAALEVFPNIQYLRQNRKPKTWKVSAYDVELLYLFNRMGYRIKEVFVTWRNRDWSVTKSQKGELARYIKESVEMSSEVLRVKLNQLKGLYNKK